MSTLALERKSSSVDVRGCFQDLQHPSTVLGAASGTEWCDDLDLRLPPRGCSGAEGQNVRKGLCKMLWLQECVQVWVGVKCVHACVCVCGWVSGERYISITCAAWLLHAHVTSLWAGLHAVVTFKDALAPLNVSACKWRRDVTELHELQNPEILLCDVNCTHICIK